MSLWEQLLSFPHFEVRIVPVRTPSNSLSKAKTFTISSFPFKANLCTIIRNLASQYFLFWVTSLLFVKYEWCHVLFKNNTVCSTLRNTKIHQIQKTFFVKNNLIHLIVEEVESWNMKTIAMACTQIEHLTLIYLFSLWLRI